MYSQYNSNNAGGSIQNTKYLSTSNEKWCYSLHWTMCSHVLVTAAWLLEACGIATQTAENSTDPEMCRVSSEYFYVRNACS